MKFITVAIFLLISVVLPAQVAGYVLYEKQDKHFFGVAYGFGENFWSSRTENFNLYNQQGGVVLTGDSKFTAKNFSQQIQLETLVPVSDKLRLGLGIAFEEFELHRIKIEGKDENIPFVEIFRFDKIFGQAEMPLNILKSKFLSFNANFRAGFYGFFSVKSPNLFGDERLGKTYFTSLGMLVDVPFTNQAYFFLHPFFEYKYFNNRRVEKPHLIYHNMISYNLAAGIRVHIK